MTASCRAEARPDRQVGHFPVARRACGALSLPVSSLINLNDQARWWNGIVSVCSVAHRPLNDPTEELAI
jgi:hypothetical protein